MNSVAELPAALALIDAFEGRAESFTLCLAESFHDPVGLNVAVATDRILAKGWEPMSVERVEGYRLYRYKEAE
jgi:hypothetical protein